MINYKNTIKIPKNKKKQLLLLNKAYLSLMNKLRWFNRKFKIKNKK